uniref:Uncharacterized protein n=1 Tax=Romanomermis culicivorax TaxID=13658 RepID=A0A915IVG1_ROMCU
MKTLFNFTDYRANYLFFEDIGDKSRITFLNHKFVQKKKHLMSFLHIIGVIASNHIKGTDKVMYLL